MEIKNEEEQTQETEAELQQELLLDIKHELLKAISFSYRTTLK